MYKGYPVIFSWWKWLHHDDVHARFQICIRHEMVSILLGCPLFSPVSAMRLGLATCQDIFGDDRSPWFSPIEVASPRCRSNLRLLIIFTCQWFSVWECLYLRWNSLPPTPPPQAVAVYQMIDMDGWSIYGVTCMQMWSEVCHFTQLFCTLFILML